MAHARTDRTHFSQVANASFSRPSLKKKIFAPPAPSIKRRLIYVCTLVPVV